MSGYNVLIPDSSRARSPEVALPVMAALQELGHTPVVLSMASISGMYNQMRHQRRGCYEIFGFYAQDLLKKSEIDFGFSVGLSGILQDTAIHESHNILDECGVPNVIYLHTCHSDTHITLKEVGALEWRCTYLACSSKLLAEQLRNAGFQRVSHVPLGTSLRVFYPHGKTPADAAFPLLQSDPILTEGYEISFCGSYDPLRARYLSALVTAGLPLAIFGDSRFSRCEDLKACYRRPVDYLRELNTVLNASKINLDLPHENCAYPDFVSARLPDCLAGQNFVATWRRAELNAVFESDHEVATFDDEGELVQLARYYLDNDLERHKIATRANGRIREECSWARRLGQLLPQLEMHLLVIPAQR